MRGREKNSSVGILEEELVRFGETEDEFGSDGL